MAIAVTIETQKKNLAAVMERARQVYAASVAGLASAPAWWTAVVVTANSARQAEWYRAEIKRRREGGKIPDKAQYLVVPDPGEGGSAAAGRRCTRFVNWLRRCC